jgi:Damage-control phosphatase ARMT1-like domain
VVTTSSIPKLPLPSSLLGSEVGSFTEFTVTQRMPSIARRVIAENKFPPNINQSLEKLASELPSGYLQLILNDTGADFLAWNNYLEPYKDQRWLDVPWFFAETYFYRLILEITNYFRPGEWQGLETTMNQLFLCAFKLINRF